MAKRFNWIIVAMGIASLGAVSAGSGVQTAEEASLPLPAAEEVSENSVQDQVRLLRDERIEKMPYLDEGFIRKTITVDTVRDREEFILLGKKSLADVIERAIQVHTPAIAARERIGLANRRVWAALRELFPEMNLKYQHRDGSLGSGGPFNSRDWRWTFRQPIFRGGILWNTLLQEKSDLMGAEKQYDVVLGDLIKDVSAAYFKYNRQVENVIDHQRAIDKARPFAKLSEQKWDEELISEIEHLNVQSLYSQMQYDHESARQEMELAHLELESFLGVSSDRELPIAELYNLEEMMKKNRAPASDSSLEEPSIAEPQEQASAEGGAVPNLEILTDLAYQNRPELQVESSKLFSARLEERIKWGELMPRVDLVMEFGKLGEAFNEVDLDPKLQKEFRLLLEAQWNVGGSTVQYQFENDARAPTVSQFQGGGSGSYTTRNQMTVNILDGLEALVAAKEAQVEKLDQIEELENAEKEVNRDVKTAYFNYQRALIQLRSTIKRAVYRDRLVVLSRHRLDNNEIQISEYMQAEIDLLRERSSMHEALEAYYTAKAELNRGVGIRDFMTVEETYEG